MRENQFHLQRLRAGIKPFRLHFFSSCKSTNDLAATMRKEQKLFAPAVVLCGRQIAGRGRGSNTWWSGAGGLTVTIALPIDSARQPHQLPLIAGLATRDAVAKITGNEKIQLKWPNDLIFDGRKLAGLLCERVHNIDLVGLGVNVNHEPGVPAGLKKQIIFLSEFFGRPIDKSAVLIEIVSHLHRMLRGLDENPFQALLREYDSHHVLNGREVSVDPGNGSPLLQGRCDGIDSIGRLLVISRGQTHRVLAGHVNWK